MELVCTLSTAATAGLAAVHVSVAGQTNSEESAVRCSVLLYSPAVPLTAVIAVKCIASLLLSCYLCVGLWVLYHAKQKVMKAASPVFCALIVVGACIAIATVFVLPTYGQGQQQSHMLHVLVYA